MHWLRLNSSDNCYYIETYIFDFFEYMYLIINYIVDTCLNLS